MIMFKLLTCFVAAFVAVQATGDFVVLHSPNSVVFQGHEEVEQSLLKEVLAAALGFTSKLRGIWNGMFITDPFSLPEAVIAVVLEGVDSLDGLNGHRFALNVNEVEETTWQALRERLEERDHNNTLVRIYLGDGVDALGHSALGELKPASIDETSLGALTLQNEEDKKFLEEVQLLHAIAKKAPSAIKPDSKSDVYWLVVSELWPILNTHGKNSTASKEALLLLNNALNAIRDAFIQAYDGQVLVVAFTNDASKVHHIRSVTLDRQTRDTFNMANNTKSIESTLEAKRVHDNIKFNTNNNIAVKRSRRDEKKNVEDEEDLNTTVDSTSESNNDTSTSPNSNTRNDSDVSENDQEHKKNRNTLTLGQESLAKKYSKDYPVFFNIFLWFGVVFVFSLLAICISISEMDPGRDSIIYRMTSNRMKKDN